MCDPAASIEYANKKLRITREIGDRRGEGYALLYVGTAHLALGDAGKALKVFTEEGNGSQRITDRLGEGYRPDGMGAAQLRLGDASRALELYEPALTIQKEIEDE